MSMSAPTLKRFPEAGMKAASVVSAYMLQAARPLFWHIGVMNDSVLRGASTFILQFADRHVAVTADHVITQYLEALAEDERTLCQIGLARVWPERALLDRSTKLDIATFEVDPERLPQMGAVAFDCRYDWPPPETVIGDTLTLAGYLDLRRNKLGKGHYEMEAWGAHGIADGISDREIVTVYDTEKTFAADGVAKPPLGYNMSGCSGGPVIVLKVLNGLMRWFPVGFIYKGPDGKAEGEFATFDRIHIRKLHFIQPDGTIREPETGWLPT